jgi:hypothetical protein
LRLASGGAGSSLGGAAGAEAIGVEADGGATDDNGDWPAAGAKKELYGVEGVGSLRNAGATKPSSRGAIVPEGMHGR